MSNSRFKDKEAKKAWAAKLKFIRENSAINPFESTQAQIERKERAKNDYTYFIETYLPMFATAKTPPFHVKAAKMIRRNKEISLWLKFGRGLAKSVMCDVTVPLWLWINNDIKFMVIIGQNEDKAKLLLDDIMLQFEGNQLLAHDFGAQQKQGSWESGFFITNNGFIGKALGMGQDPRGLRVGSDRPDLIICDDWETKETIKNPKRQQEYAHWLLTAVLPTMDGARERVLLAQNHFAPRMIFDIIVSENEGWKIIQQNAFDNATFKPLWPEKYADDFFIKKIKKLGIHNVKAEYNNEPYVKGKHFTDEMIQWMPCPRLDSFVTITATWDIAFAGSNTSDFNAVRVWGLTKDDKKVLIDCFVKRSKILAALEWIAQFQMSLPKTVKVQFRYEKQFHNDEIQKTIEEIEKKYNIILNLIQAERSKAKKFDRIMEMNPQYQNGRIYYSESLKNHNDTKEGLIQLKQIEPGYKGNDDAPDADKEAFDVLDSFTRKRSHKNTWKKRENRKY